ncbi:M3 family metallopeptidase [Aurantiacibacter hainanensis]|uniref:M3 family metallopeptidase n=1 Tax=Aurantiacibacter hainanensis TaxID=3076114 RepID=UPI0030C756CE
MIRTISAGLLASVAFATPALAGSYYPVLGPVMTDPSVEELGARCNFYLDQLGLHRDAIIGSQSEPSVDTTLRRLDDTTAILSGAQGEFQLYQQVLLEPELRQAAGDCTVSLGSFASQLNLSQPIYQKLTAIDASDADELTQAYLTDLIADYERAGVGLDDGPRARVQEIRDRLSQLSSDFARNIAEDVRTIQVTPEELEGVPQDFIDAREVGEDGTITLTTAYTDYQPVMTYAESDDLRRRFSEVYSQRAWPENDEVLREIFTLRRELANILGRESYAALSFENRMLNTPDKVETLIADTAAAARPVAEYDYAQSLAVLQELQPGATAIMPWQTGWLSPKVQQANYDYDPQEARQYFAYDNVRDGVFALTERLFDVEIRDWDTPVWHESVEALEVVDEGEVIGRFYLDSHPRPGKFTHANVVPMYWGDPDYGPPTTALVQNLPQGDHSTGLMEHGQVETFLHEFGHVLHVIFGGTQEWAGLTPIGIEWDFIEAPSQMLENWLLDYDTLATFAVNAEGETIPRDLVERMNRVAYFNQGMMEMSQLGLSNIALKFHTEPVPDNLGAATRAWGNEYSLIPAPDYSEFQSAFSHLDGYESNYYTYGWSRVIAQDLMSRFREEGLTNPETANDYRRLILEPGGARPAAELVRDFLGRDVTMDAFRAELERGLEQ